MLSLHAIHITHISCIDLRWINSQGYSAFGKSRGHPSISRRVCHIPSNSGHIYKMDEVHGQYSKCIAELPKTIGCIKG